MPKLCNCRLKLTWLRHHMVSHSTPNEHSWVEQIKELTRVATNSPEKCASRMKSCETKTLFPFFVRPNGIMNHVCTFNSAYGIENIHNTHTHTNRLYFSICSPLFPYSPRKGSVKTPKLCILKKINLRVFIMFYYLCLCVRLCVLAPKLIRREFLFLHIYSFLLITYYYKFCFSPSSLTQSLSIRSTRLLIPFSYPFDYAA